MTSLVISGASGRLGARILAHAQAAEGIKVAGALLREGSARLSEGSPFTADEAVLQAGRVLIECAPKPAALAHAARAANVGAPILMATTGFTPAERTLLEAHADRVPVLIAPNLSLGVTVLLDLVARAAAALPGYDLEIVELHHSKKRDAPSGTAWALARAGAAARGLDADREAILARAGDIGPRGQDEIGIQSIRGGDIIGEHTVYLVGPTERLELTHRAQSRDVFAAGAITAARFLAEQKPGLYAMRDVLALS